MNDIQYESKNEDFFLSLQKQTAWPSMKTSHFHDMYEIYYLFSGERHYFIDNRTYHVKKGDMVYIKMFDLHKTLDAGASDCERCLINFKPDFLFPLDKNKAGHMFAESAFTNPVIHFSVRDQTIIEGTLLKMLKEIKDKKEGFNEMLAAYLIQLLVFTKRYVTQNTTLEQPSVKAANYNAEPIVRYINENFAEHLSLKSVSNRFFISSYYLCKVFKAYTGFTFVEYLNSVRIKEAQQILRNSDCSILEVSGRVGFGNVSNFGRVFKSIAGVSPYQYKKEYGKIK